MKALAEQLVEAFIERFNEKWMPEANSGCWLWDSKLNNKGYGVWDQVLPEESLAHRISWLIHHGPIPKGMCVLHKCDTPCCVNPNHLFLGTKQDNTGDMLAKKRHPHAKLTAEQAKEIVESQLGYRRLAKQYGLNRKTVLQIKRGEIWKPRSHATRT